MIKMLPIPDPFDLRTFLDLLGRWRGKRIELVPAALSEAAPCGMLIGTDEADYVVHAVDATPLHAQHIAMHEIGHLMFGHAEDHAVARTRPDLVELHAVRALLPDLSPAMIRRILGRTTYSDVHECEAELFASILLVQVQTVPEMARSWAA